MAFADKEVLDPQARLIDPAHDIAYQGAILQGGIYRKIRSQKIDDLLFCFGDIRLCLDAFV